MHKKLMGMAVAMTALVSIFGVAQAQDTKTIGVSIPAATHGWTSG
ncbi:MAG: ABC transporter substrate-binding protein, partial [Allorhizobium sp.]